MVANPERVEHPIVMLPKAVAAERGLPPDALLARRLSGSGGVGTPVLQTMRNAFAELPDGLAGRTPQHRSLTDIARGLGFQNMAHFGRVFRTHLGLPPSDFRRQAAG